ncbi:hypothetical protein R1sor_026531 [Riccia sorocarpa]|uniref:Uncharacterized protein n=1 Tax=Riccia sorocarpa TaxID=122646 RepID=A0ABD3GCB4_9MARC
MLPLSSYPAESRESFQSLRASGNWTYPVEILDYLQRVTMALALTDILRELRYWLEKPAQNPNPGPFNSDMIEWLVLEEGLLPIDGVEDFLVGEGGRTQTACTYTKQKTDDVEMKSGKCIVYYWCCYGPVDRRVTVFKEIPNARGMKGKGPGQSTSSCIQILRCISAVWVSKPFLDIFVPG